MIKQWKEKRQNQAIVKKFLTIINYPIAKRSFFITDVLKKENEDLLDELLYYIENNRFKNIAKVEDMNVQDISNVLAARKKEDSNHIITRSTIPYDSKYNPKYLAALSIYTMLKIRNDPDNKEYYFKGEPIYTYK